MQPADIRDKYTESFNFLQPRKRRQVSQLVLLNNLNRGDQNIASTLLLTLFNRTMAAAYDDKIQVKFLPSQGILQEQLDAYNILAQSDYVEMDKATIDYDWMWDTLFFGKGFLETLKFNKKKKIMEPVVINPLMFGYDPYFPETIEWRYYWKWLTKSKIQLEALIKAGKLTIASTTEIASGVDAYLYDYKLRRDQAKKAIEPPTDTANGDVFQILEFAGYNAQGQKCIYWTDRDSSKIIMEESLDLEVDEPWPIVVREAFREPHASVNFSVADLLEDKHRAKSVLLNLAYIAAKDKANPLYWYDPDKVKDVSQFLSRQINQHIPVEGQGDMAVGPLNTQEPMSPELINFITMLQQEATDPVGVGIQVQPETSIGHTATEAAIDQQLNDMAQSLLSKVLQFGEKDFWSRWFRQYQKYGADLGDKMANIVGVKGIDSQTIDLKVFQTDFPPGVQVYSAKEAEYKELVLRRDLMNLYPNLMQSMDADGLRNFNKHVFFPKFLQDPSLIDIMFPKTIDEMKAEDENEQLKQNEMIDVAPTDNHTTHIYTHSMVQPKTWALWYHLLWHEDELAKQKQQEQLMAQQAQPQGTAQTPQSPLQAATPLKQAIKTPLTTNTNQ